VRAGLFYAMAPLKRRLRAAAPAPAALSITVAGPAGTEQPLAGQQKTRTTIAAAPERAIINNAELRANAQNILTMIKAARPKNTATAYEPKQEEFRRFCRRKQYQDGETVTEDKLLLFLVEDVVNRPLRSRSRKADGDIPLSETRLAWRSVRTYVTAITDLYRAQRALGMNTHPSPREDNAREYIKSLQRRDTERQKANYADKGRDTLLDGYSEDDLKRIAGELWSHTSNQSAECHLRTLVDMLLGHYMLTRGGDRRCLEISDLFTFEFPGEGPTRCIPLIITTRAGKQNQHGRLETAGALRSRDPAICVLGAVAFYLLLRWDLTDEPFPSFKSRSQWYDIRLLKSTEAGPTSELAYNSQRDWVIKAFKYAGIQSNKKTHIGRSSGAKTAELKGVSEAQIRRAGRWNQEQMVGCYLNSLPRKFMRTMAGHPAQIGGFEIRRSRVRAPDSLLTMIWPDLNQWAGKFGPDPGQIQDLAATGFTDLLFYFREVILEDSVPLMRQFPESVVWNHPVFQHQDYRPYARRIADLIDEGERPSQLAVLTQALPVLTEYLKAAEARKEAQIAELSAALTTEIRTAEERLAGTYQASIREILAGSVFRLQSLPGPASLPAPASIPAPILTPAVVPSPSPAPTSAPASLSTSDSSRSSRSSRSVSPESEPPKYRMSRTVKTVSDLWREWTTGIRGGPSITALDNRWGSRWRAGRQAEVQWYSLRLEVIREIRRVAGLRRISEESAMCFVAAEQRQSHCSLDLYCKRLRANRKTREATGAGAGADGKKGRRLAR